MQTISCNTFDFTDFLKEPERTREQNMTTDEKRAYRAEMVERGKASHRQLYRGVFVHMHKWNTKGKRGFGRKRNRRHAQQWPAMPRRRGPAARRYHNRTKQEG